MSTTKTYTVKCAYLGPADISKTVQVSTSNVRIVPFGGDSETDPWIGVYELIGDSKEATE